MEALPAHAGFDKQNEEARLRASSEKRIFRATDRIGDASSRLI
jgi:hypothetical protein